MKCQPCGKILITHRALVWRCMCADVCGVVGVEVQSGMCAEWEVGSVYWKVGGVGYVGYTLVTF